MVEIEVGGTVRQVGLGEESYRLVTEKRIFGLEKKAPSQLPLRHAVAELVVRQLSHTEVLTADSEGVNTDPATKDYSGTLSLGSAAVTESRGVVRNREKRSLGAVSS